MKRETQLKVQAYLDNELSPGDARNVSNMIGSDAEARDLFNELKETRQILVQNEPVVSLPESREFYWSKIERAIAAAEKSRPVPMDRPWWLRLLAPVAGSVALFAILLSVMDRGGNPVTLTRAPNGEFATPMHQMEMAPDVSTITFRSEAEGITVVWVSTQ